MKNKLSLNFTVILVSVMLLSPSTSKAILPLGEYTYADEIRVDSEFEWELKQLDNLEEVYGSTEDFFIDDVQLVEGASIKLVVTENPNTANGTWYDIFVDDIKVTDPSNMSVSYAPFYMYTYPNYFISPIQFSNTTGIYDYFEVVYKDYLEGVYTIREYTGLPTYTNEVQVIQIGDLDESTITTGLRVLDYRYEVNPDGSEEYRLFSLDVSNTIDRNTGLLLENHFLFDHEFYITAPNGTKIVHDQAFNHYLIELKPEPTSFSWIISLVGLSSFGVMVWVLKRRRK